MDREQGKENLLAALCLPCPISWLEGLAWLNCLASGSCCCHNANAALCFLRFFVRDSESLDWFGFVFGLLCLSGADLNIGSIKLWLLVSSQSKKH